MTKRTRTTLEAKVFLTMTGILFVVLLGIGHFAIRTESATISTGLKDRFDAVARSLALGAGEIASNNSGELAQNLSSKIRRQEMGLEYVVIVDSSGRTLFADSHHLEGTALPGSVPPAQMMRKILGYDRASEDVYHISVPVRLNDGSAGRFSAGFSNAEVTDAISSMHTSILLVVSLGFAVGIAFTLMMARGTSRAVKSLIQSARSVAAGDLSCKVPNSGTGELGELTQAFNYMLDVICSNQEHLIERANTDSLTGLYNHRFFQERLEEEISRAARYGSSISVLLLDIDYFKRFNDEHGHPSGDEALRVLGRVLTESVRDCDVPVRYGGEEFAVILPQTKIDAAMGTAERIRKAVESSSIIGTNGESLSLTVSIGVAEYPLLCADRAGLVATADVALYHAKAQGRNRVERYSVDFPAMPKADPYKLYVLLQAEDQSTIEALAEAIDAKLKLPAGHSRVVATTAELIGRKMGLDDDACSAIHLAALLRDVGQIAIPDSVLGKNGKLTRDEMAAVATHPALGHAIVQKAPNLCSVLPGILHHHERYDGTGYPSHLAGDQIPLEARIISVADAYQSMLIVRPHRRRLSPGEAQMELVEKSGTQFDRTVVQAFLEVLADESQRQEAA